MKKTLIFTLILILSCYAEITFAQSEIWLLEGKKIKTDTIILDSTELVIYKNKKGNYKYFDKSEVFSVKQNEQTKYFYKPDTAEGTFTVSEMEDYLQGIFDCKEYKSSETYSGGLLTGIIAPMVLPAIGIPTVFSPIFPAAYAIIAGIPEIKEKKLDIPKQYQNNEHYKFGYKRTAKKKKITKTIFVSTIGLIIGLGEAYLIYNIE